MLKKWFPEDFIANLGHVMSVRNLAILDKVVNKIWELQDPTILTERE